MRRPLFWSTGSPAPATEFSPTGMQPTPVPTPTALPVLYNLGGGLGSVWDNPQVRAAGFLVFADGSAAITGMHWASGAEQYAEDDRKRRKEAEVRNTAEQ